MILLHNAIVLYVTPSLTSLDIRLVSGRHALPFCSAQGSLAGHDIQINGKSQGPRTKLHVGKLSTNALTGRPHLHTPFISLHLLGAVFFFRIQYLHMYVWRLIQVQIGIVARNVLHVH